MEKIDKYGQVLPISDLIYIKSIIQVIDDDDQDFEVEIGWENQFGERSFVTKLSTIVSSQENGLMALIDKGYLVPFNFMNDIRKYLVQSAIEARDRGMVQKYHRTLGFLKKQDQPWIYLLGDGIVDDIKSSYHKPHHSFKRGNPDDYVQFVKKQILPYPMMRLALTFGLSAIVSSYLQVHADIGTLIVNYSGASSTGKTTSAAFNASLFGNPKMDDDFLMRSFNSTDMFKIDVMKGVHGVCIVYDDSTADEGYNKRTSMIYQLSQSQPRSRMMQNGGRQLSREKWSGTIIITSETPILDSSDTRMGLIARVIDTDGMIWTESAEHAEIIKRFVHECYGHIGPLFAERFLSIDHDLILQTYDEIKNEVLKNMVKRNSLSSRIASKIAIFVMTTKLIKELLGFEVDEQETMKILVDKDQQEVEEKHVGEKALEIIKHFIITNHYQFEKTDKFLDQLIPPKGKLMGRIIYDGKLATVVIPSLNVESILKDNYIFDKRTIYEYWSSNNLIRQQSGRSTIKDAKLGVRCVFFKFTRDLDSLIPWYGKIDDDEKDKSDSPMLIYEKSYNDEEAVDDIFREREQDEN